MKEVLALRHAKSSWSDPGLSDLERPLNRRGEKAAPEMARRLLELGLRPQRVLCSHAVRARQTAERVAEVLGLPEGSVEIDERLYLASADEILGVLSECDDHFDRVLFVGHNPGIHAFVARFGRVEVGKFPTAALAQIRWPVERWAGLGGREGETLHFDTPRRRAG